MRTFYKLLINALIAGITNNFVWFALTFWAYLETKSVLATSIVTGAYLVMTALCGFWFGSIVDHHKKKTAMLISSIITVILFSLTFLVYLTSPEDAFTTVNSFYFWVFSFLLLFGVVAGNIRNIALPTAVTLLVPEDKRDRANGLSGTIMGISFAICSVASGLILANGGMFWVLVTGVGATLLAILHLAFISIPEKEIVHTEEKPKRMDISGTIHAIRSIPGLFALIFFTTFNNFMGGVFMALMDAYGLTLVSLEVWGTLWGILSLGFIAGGLYIAKKGLGENPLRNLFIINTITWSTCLFFPLQPSIVLLVMGIIFWVTLGPFVEATEQTIIQKVVPPERQGRVFGFAQSVEMAASPITAFLIGPIAQFIFIPFMTTGAGVDLIGSWFGVGPGRGIALVFILSGIIGLCVTLVAMRSKSYKLLYERYKESKSVEA